VSTSPLPDPIQEHQDRRLQALIGALEEHDTATMPQLLEALAVRLPAGDLPSAGGAVAGLTGKSGALHGD
jgi:hypothetical protein